MATGYKKSMIQRRVLVMDMYHRRPMDAVAAHDVAVHNAFNRVTVWIRHTTVLLVEQMPDSMLCIVERSVWVVFPAVPVDNMKSWRGISGQCCAAFVTRRARSSVPRGARAVGWVQR